MGTNHGFTSTTIVKIWGRVTRESTQGDTRKSLLPGKACFSFQWTVFQTVFVLILFLGLTMGLLVYIHEKWIINTINRTRGALSSDRWKKRTIRSNGLCGFNGLVCKNCRSIRLQRMLMYSVLRIMQSQKGAECICISKMAGESQEHTSRSKSNRKSIPFLPAQRCGPSLA